MSIKPPTATGEFLFRALQEYLPGIEHLDITGTFEQRLASTRSGLAKIEQNLVNREYILMAEIKRLRDRMIKRGVNPDEKLMEYYETPEGNIAIRPSSTNPPMHGILPDPTQPELQQPLP